MLYKSKYKVGDRVRVVQPTATLEAGSEYTIAQISDIGYPRVETTKGLLSYADDYFELISSARLSDQELADKFIALEKESFETLKELCDRGYSYFVAGEAYSFDELNFQYKIAKTITTEVVLIDVDMETGG